MKYLFSVLGLILTIAVQGQRAYSSQVYHLANLEQAKVAIAMQDYESAYQIYEAHFQLDMPAFAEDHYNALLLAADRKNWSLVLKTGRELRKSGFCAKQLKLILEDFTDPNRSTELLNYFEQVTEEYDDLLQTQISLLLQKERAVRSDGSEEEIAAVTQENYESFLHLVDQFGFPTERSSGLFCINTIPNYKELPLDVLLIYFAHAKMPDLESLLDEAFRSGALPLSTFLYYRNILNIQPYLVPNPLYAVNSQYYLVKLNDDQKSAIEYDRKTYGFPSFETQISAIEANLTNPPALGRHRFALGRLVDVIGMDGYPDEVIQQYFVEHKVN